MTRVPTSWHVNFESLARLEPVLGLRLAPHFGGPHPPIAISLKWIGLGAEAQLDAIATARQQLKLKSGEFLIHSPDDGPGLGTASRRIEDTGKRMVSSRQFNVEDEYVATGMGADTNDGE